MPEWGLLSWRGAHDYLRLARRLRRIVHHSGIGQVHCGRCLPEGVLCLALKKWIGLPYMCYVHGEDISTATNSREHAFLVKSVLANAQYCIANSRNTATLLRERWRMPEARIRVLHPGVDTRQFWPTPRSVQVRRQLEWGQRPVILTVGRLQRRKGHAMLVRALPEILAQIPGVLYSIVGAGEERVPLEQLARELNVFDHVQFRGEPNDGELLLCYQQCDVFALPNREVNGDIEGFGMVLLEAQACGKPVIAGSSGGTAETMQVGQSGLIVDCREPDELACSLIKLLTNHARRHHMGIAAREWVVARFDWDSLAQQACQIFCDGHATTRCRKEHDTPNSSKAGFL